MYAAGQNCFNFIQDHGARLFSGKPIGNKNGADVDVKASGCARLTSCVYLILLTFPAGLVGCMLSFPSLVGRCCRCCRSKKLNGDASVRKTSDAGETILGSSIPKSKSASPKSVSQESQSPKSNNDVQEHEHEAPVDPLLQKRDAQIKKLEQELAEVTQECQTLKTQQSEAEKAATPPNSVPIPPDQEAEVNSLKQQLAEKEEERTQSADNTKKIQAEVTKLQEASEIEINKLKARVEAYKKLEESAKGTLESEQQRLTELHKEINELHDKLKQSNTVKSELYEELKNKKNLLVQLTEKLENAKSELDQTKKMYGELQQKATASKTENSANKKALGTVQERVTELENELSHNKEELASLKKQIKKQHDEYASLEEKERQSTEQLAEIRKQNDITKEKIKNLAANLEESIAALNKISSENNGLKQELEKQKNLLLAEQEKSKQLKTDNRTFSDLISSLKAKLQEDKEKFAVLEKKLVLANNSSSENDTIAKRFKRENEILNMQDMEMRVSNIMFFNNINDEISNLYQSMYGSKIITKEEIEKILSANKDNSRKIDSKEMEYLKEKAIETIIMKKIKETQNAGSEEEMKTKNALLNFYSWVKLQQKNIKKHTYCLDLSKPPLKLDLSKPLLKV